jgi:transposase InsO family protein
MKRIASALGISRPHLSQSSRTSPTPRSGYDMPSDAEVLARIGPLVRERATYGYRRVTALLNRDTTAPRVNHKRIYRIMKRAGLLLPKYTGLPERPHNGKVITLKSDLRWCSDSFEIRCWNGERVHVAFSLDCCDREAIAWVASSEHLTGRHIQDLIAMSVEARFAQPQTPRPIEWLSDNGPPYTATETRAFGAACGLLMCNTPAYCPESNGIAEAFVKTFKRDYVYLGKVDDAATVIAQLPGWFRDYNHVGPHKGLKMLSPSEFRRLHTQQ